MAGEFQVSGTNAAALFTLKIHRGEGMALLAMNWKNGEPPDDFVGFAIEYQEPGGERFFALKNRLALRRRRRRASTRISCRRMLSPIQKFRWVHFPRNAELPGEFVYRVTPVFMNDARRAQLRRAAGGRDRAPARDLSRPAQRRLHPRLRVVAGVRRPLSRTPGRSRRCCRRRRRQGLTSCPRIPRRRRRWPGWASRRARAILDVLDQAIADPSAQVRVVAYDLNEPEIVSAARAARQRG